MAVNAAKAASRLAAATLRGEDTEVDEEGQETRWDICRECPLFRPSDERCAECGCWLKAKIPLSTEICGLYKWPGDLQKALEEL
jgi:hypothetical protein